FSALPPPAIRTPVYLVCTLETVSPTAPTAISLPTIEELVRMFSKKGARLFAVGVIFVVTALGGIGADADRQEKAKPGDHKALRDTANKKFRDGNYKDAYEGLRKLALDPDNDPKLVGQDLTTAITCLQYLGRVDEVDAFREGVITRHAKNWRLLETAALSFRQTERYGYIVAGEFSR